ncbi:MAG: endopeptidase La, partial [Chitinophagaceae bacterium]|nr:endopeptidase La [Chitinophagaceae bacterium]
MNEKNLFLGSGEEDVDFLPIIPLNEAESDNEEEMEIPDELPILPLRNTVLFPGVVLPITVGRDKSIQAVNEAYKTNKLVGVVAQKDSNVEDPTVIDLEYTGTIAKVVKLIKMPDGGTTVIIQGKKRFRINMLTSDDPFFKAKVEVLQEEPTPEDENFKALAGSIKDMAAQIIQLSPNIPSEASIILKNIENPAFLVHFVSNNLNSDISEKQRLLETQNIKQRAELLLTLLQKELQYTELKNKVTNKTRTELDKQQREYFLHQQMKSIKEELGGDAN